MMFHDSQGREYVAAGMGLFLGVTFGCLWCAFPAAFHSPTELLILVGQLWEVPDRLGCKSVLLLPADMRGMSWMAIGQKLFQNPGMVGATVLVVLLLTIRRLADFMGGHQGFSTR